MLKKLLIYLLFFLIPPNLCFGLSNEQDKVLEYPTANHVIENLYGKNHGYTKQKLANKLLTDDEFAVMMTLRYYQYLLKVFGYDRKKAILAYNVGLGRVLKYGLSFDPNNYLSKVLIYRKEIQFIC